MVNCIFQKQTPVAPVLNSYFRWALQLVLALECHSSAHVNFRKHGFQKGRLRSSFAPSSIHDGGRPYVRLWPKADILMTRDRMSAFGGKADIGILRRHVRF